MMLILTRKPGERIIARVGGKVLLEIVLVKCQGGGKRGPGKARIGVQADDDISIDRAEVDFSKERERANAPKKKAATATPA